VAEIVREKIFIQYRNEIPYACQVTIFIFIWYSPPSALKLKE